MNSGTVIEEVEQRGWVALPGMEAEELTALAQELGTSAEAKWLRTRVGTDATSPSLTAFHGRGGFPPHTDGATRPRPPRFVALFAEQSYRAATELFDGESEALRVPEFSNSWLVSNGRRRFYVVPRRSVGGQARWRLNPDVMAPVGAGDAASAMARFGSLKKVRIEWEPGLAVIWDNQRMLHAREAVGAADGERALLRISVNE